MKTNKPLSESRFNRCPSVAYRKAVTALADLDEKEGTVDEAYAEVAATRNERRWSNLFKKSTGYHVCLSRLLGKRCEVHGGVAPWEDWRKQETPCILPGSDHNSMWRRKSTGQLVYVTQPYELNFDQLCGIVDMCREYQLRASISPRLSWHFPGSTLLVTVVQDRAAKKK
jgi:hypothetical protein